MKKLVILLAVLGIAGISSANAIGGLYTFDGIPDQTVAGDGYVYESGGGTYSQWVPAAGSGTIVSVVGETLSHVGSIGAGWTSSYSYYHDFVAGETYALEFDLVSDQSNGIVARFVGAGLDANFDNLATLGHNVFYKTATADLGTLTLQLGGFGDGEVVLDNISVSVATFPAHSPIPEDETNVFPTLSSLAWSNPDFDDVICTVFLGTDPNRLDMDSVLTGLDETSVDINSTNFPNFYNLQVGQTYYWAVDCNSPSDGVVPGDYWSFIVSLNEPPVVEAGNDQDVWLGKSGTPGQELVTLSGTVTDVDGPYPTDILWEQTNNGAPAVTIDPNDVEETSITFTERGNYQFILTAGDGIAAPVPDTVTIIVGDTACDASHIKTGDPYNIGDYNEDCIVDLTDFMELIASQWLDCTDTVTGCN